MATLVEPLELQAHLVGCGRRKRVQQHERQRKAATSMSGENTGGYGHFKRLHGEHPSELK